MNDSDQHGSAGDSHQAPRPKRQRTAAVQDASHFSKTGSAGASPYRGESSYSDLVRRIVEFSHEAGRRIMHFYRAGASSFDARLKADASPLTAADLASHDYLVGAVASLATGAPVVSEESEDRIHCDWSGKVWLIDPLDGTKEFIKGKDAFTVNVALVEGGRPVLGVVHAPALGRTYYGVVGQGAWRAAGESAPEGISCRPCDLSEVALVASKDHAGPLVQKLMQKLPRHTLQSMGSSLKFCLVAEGKADIYLRDLPTMEWDTAAAQAIVEAAGGGVYELSGQALRYGKEDLRNPAILTVGKISDFSMAILRSYL